MGANPTPFGTIAQRYGGNIIDYKQLAAKYGATKSQTAHEDLVERSKKAYPFINRTNPIFIPTTKEGGEAWPIGETGDPDYPRPQSIPLNQHGIEIGPGSTEADIAGEVLHIDPYAKNIRDRLSQSLKPEQIKYLKHESLDYGIANGMSEQQRMQNAVDAAIRGTVVGQWPQEANQGMNYTPEQQGLLNQLQQYMKTPPSGLPSALQVLGGQ